MAGKQDIPGEAAQNQAQILQAVRENPDLLFLLGACPREDQWTPWPKAERKPRGGPLLLDYKAAAKVLGLGEYVFLRMSDTGRLGPKPITFGRYWDRGRKPSDPRLVERWSKVELEEWVKAGRPDRWDWEGMKEKRGAPKAEPTEDVKTTPKG